MQLTTLLCVGRATACIRLEPPANHLMANNAGLVNVLESAQHLCNGDVTKFCLLTVLQFGSALHL